MRYLGIAEEGVKTQLLVVADSTRASLVPVTERSAVRYIAQESPAARAPRFAFGAPAG